MTNGTATYIRPPDDAPEHPDRVFFEKMAEEMMGALIGDEDDFPEDLIANEDETADEVPENTPT